MEIGFIGLGAMGMPMARNLAQRLKIRPHVFDLNSEALEMASAWAEACHSPREVARTGGIVISMLPADAHVRQVALGEDGLVNHTAGRFVYADFSTINPKTLKDVAAALETRGVTTIGGACTLGVAAAEKGTLAIYVDGDESLVEQWKPVLASFAKTILYIGSLGQAKLIKLMNNYLAAVNVALTAEALEMGMKAGIGLEMLIDLLQKGSADSYVLRNHFAKNYVNGDIGPGKFGIDYMVKDMNILADYCRSTHAPLTIGATATSLYRGASAAGYGRHYYPVILRWLKETTEARA